MANTGGLNQEARGKKKAGGNTGKLISSYYLEIEYLLDRVEQSATHYQALALERSATSEEIVNAYQETIKVLHPPYHKVRSAISDDILERIDQSFSKVSQAFFVLTDRDRKMEYDRSISRSLNGASCAEATPAEQSSAPLPPPVEIQQNGSQSGTAQEAISIRNNVSGQAVFSKPVGAISTVNRRRCDRLKLSMPIMLVAHHRATGKWQEVGKTIDVSKMGVGIVVNRRLQPGLVVHLTVPFPTKLRSHGYSDPSYNVYAIVRRAEPLMDGVRVVGLEFLGEHPPEGYLKEPWSAFRTQKWPGADRRRNSRAPLSEAVTIDYLDELMEPIRKETAVTENVSIGGARIRVKIHSPESDVLKVTNHRRSFESVAMVRNRYIGKDGFERLCIQFTDMKWPM
jgi:curved DNA-binding protein CbpA